MIMLKPWRVALVVAFASTAAGDWALAQQPAGPPQQTRTQARPAAAGKASPAKETARGVDGADSQLRGRVEQLEEQLADMQVVIGTLESLGRAGNAGGAATGAPARGGAGGGVEQARIDSLETQIRALTAEVEQLAGQIRQISGNRRGDAGILPPVGSAGGPSNPPTSTFGRDGGGPTGAGGGFGATTVTQGERQDPIGRMLGSEAPQAASAAPGLPPSAAAAGNPRELYETAYGYLLQQDYGAAEVAFEEFLRRYPQERLAADAQYWLGETLYVQRRYKPAGQAFLAVVEKHKQSAKVPNSLLKLAQSLDQLGQKDCGIFNELESRHPNAPADVRVKARALKQKQGC